MCPGAADFLHHGAHVVRAVPALVPAQPNDSHAKTHISQFRCPGLQKRDHSNISYLI
jgi:hypothetical protein